MAANPVSCIYKYVCIFIYVYKRVRERGRGIVILDWIDLNNVITIWLDGCRPNCSHDGGGGDGDDVDGDNDSGNKLVDTHWFKSQFFEEKKREAELFLRPSLLFSFSMCFSVSFA